MGSVAKLSAVAGECPHEARGRDVRALACLRRERQGTKPEHGFHDCLRRGPDRGLGCTWTLSFGTMWEVFFSGAWNERCASRTKPIWTVLEVWEAACGGKCYRKSPGNVVRGDTQRLHALRRVERFAVGVGIEETVFKSNGFGPCSFMSVAADRGLS